MALHPEDPTSPPEETRRVARAAFPKGTLCLAIADALGPIYRDSQFAGLFPRRGPGDARPGDGSAVHGRSARPPGRRRRARSDRLEVRLAPAADRPRFRPYRPERVPLPPGRGQSRAADP